VFRWAALIAAVVLIMAVAGAILSSQKSIEPSQPQATENNHKESGAEKKEITLFDQWFPDSTAVFNLFLMIFTGVLAFGGLIQLNLLTRAEHIAADTAQAAKQSAEVAKDTLVATNRPWISVDIGIASDLTYDAQGDARIVIKFILKNVGKSPATNVRIEPEFAVIFGDSRPFQKAISDRQKLRPAGLGNLGVTLFPGETQIHSHNLPISRVAIDTYIKKMAADYGEEAAKTMGMSFLPTLVGCVDYKFTFAEGHHQTGFILDLRKRDPTNPNIALHFDIAEGTIPADRLWLIQGFIGIAPD